MRQEFFQTIFTLQFCFCLSFCYSQTITKQDLHTDLLFLQDAIKKAHGSTYLGDEQPNFAPIIDSIISNTPNRLSPELTRSFINQILVHLGFVHTSISKFPLSNLPDSIFFFSKAIHVENGDWFMYDPLSKQQNKQKIVAINNVQTADLQHELYRTHASDGGSDAYGRAYFKRFSCVLISRYFNYRKDYEIIFETDTLTLPATTNAVSSLKINDSLLRRVITNNANFLTYIDSIPLLKINSFSSSDKKFFKKIFKQPAIKSSSNLIIDLRGNTGGNRKATTILTSRLVDSAFSYWIVQPKTQPYQYLSKVGKRNWILSRLKFNVLEIYRKSKTDQGNSFRYQKKARKAFDGKIWILTDGFTASASTMVTSWLRQHKDTFIVGEQASGGYNGNNGGTFPTILLPTSQIEIKFPLYRLVLDPKSTQKQGILPDLKIEQNLDDLFQNVDTQLEKLLLIIKLNSQL